MSDASSFPTPEELKRQTEELRAANQNREDALHRRGACSDALSAQVRTEAFIDVVIDELGAREIFELEVERRRAALYDPLNAQIDQAQKAQREQAILGGPFPVRGGDGA